MDKLNNQIEKELKNRIKSCHHLGQTNYRLAYLVILTAIITNIFATFFVATDYLLKPYTALLTAMPGILLLLNRTLKFEDKARWYWKHMRKLDGLLRAMEFESKQAAEISHELTEIDEMMDAEWPGFGKVPSPLES